MHRSLLSKWERIFQQHQVTDPWLSVKWLAEHVHPNALLKNFEFSEDDTLHFESLCRRRLNHEPVQYIIGQWSFCGIPDFKIRPPTLIFRPRTENFVDIVTTHYQQHYQSMEYPLRFMDIGCGSGVITATLLSRFENARAIAMDCQQHALDLTKVNCEHIGVMDRVEMVHSKIEEFNGNGLASLESLDFIISNPPYVPSHDFDEFAPDIRKYEDSVAFDGGSDGLDVIRVVLRESPKYLKQNGLLWIEGYLTHCSWFKEQYEMECMENYGEMRLVETYREFLNNTERFACFEKCP